MSNVKTGVRVDGNLKESFQSATDNDRFIKAIVSEDCSKIEKVTTVGAQSTWENDFDLVPPLLEDRTPCFIIYRTDRKGHSTPYLWYLLSFIPDDAKVKQKMLYSATRSSLVSDLGGENHFIDYIHGTTQVEFSKKGFQIYYESKTSEVPLSDQEKTRKEEREQEVNTIVELVSIVKNSTSGGQSNVLFPIDDTIPEAINYLTSGQFNYLRLCIDQKKERIMLDEACFVELADLPSKVPPTDCAFHFFNWAHNHEGQDLNSLIFVFSTPDGSNGQKPAPVRSRMLYASSKQHVVSFFTNLNCTFDCKMEIGSGDELLESEFSSLIHPLVTKEEKTAFKKPTGPKSRKGTNK